VDGDLHWTPARELLEQMAARTVSPVEVMETFLTRVERLSPVLNPFITVVADQALEASQRAEQAIMRREPLGPLHGLPICIKDVFWTEGIRTTYGSRLFEDFVPKQDATFAARLRAAGAIIFAKNNTPEFSGNPRTVNLLTRECLTPWDPALERSSGGSSGGSGVSVAAGLGPVSIGSDDGGSIRLPSAFNGVFGFLPSRGRVPVGPCSYQAPMQCVGPMTRDVRDAALVLGIIAGHDSGDFLSSTSPAPDYLTGLDDGVAGVRIAWSPDFGRIEAMRPDAVEVAHEAAKTFAGLGARLDEPNLRLQDVHDPLELEPRLSVAQAYYPSYDVPTYYHYQQFLADLRHDPDKWAQLTIYVRERFDGSGERPTQLEYAMSIPPGVRNRPIDHLEDVFARYDLLACPVIARPAFVAGEPGVTTWNYTEYTLIVNVAGYAAASVPAGFVDGLPVGLQLIAPPDREPLLLRAARALERDRPWAEHHPPIS
jgi:Asp-tRNA(Asn)/Glu-tRNA(Gln) amidotransferase A subunit family amidase